MRIAFLVVDDRFDRPLPEPYFGSAPTALLQGFIMLSQSHFFSQNETATSIGYPNSFEIHVICCGKKTIPAPSQLAENIWYHQIVLPSWSYLRLLHAGPILAVRRKLKEIQPDVIHAQGTERWCAISAAFSPYPKILTIHGNLRLINKVTPMQPRSYWKTQELLETFSIPKYNGVVCITNYTQDNIRDLAQKTWVIPNAVDATFFELGNQRFSHDPQAPSQRSLQSPYRIIVIANIQPRKNQNAFIDALEPLAQDFNFQVTFYGRGQRGDDFSNGFFDRIESLEWCVFGGMLDRKELGLALNSAHLLVLPSLEDNCPMSVLEAMASGVPVIAPNVGGVPDLIRHEQNGLLIDPTSHESMSKAVKRMLRDPALATKLAKQAYLDAKAKYHPSVVAKKHLAIYHSLKKAF